MPENLVCCYRETGRGTDTEKIVESLNLSKELTFDDVMRIAMRTQDLCKEDNLPQVMLERLIMIDYRARDGVPDEVYNKESDSDDSDEEDDKSSHDIFYIIFSYCNAMLKNVLVSKLFKCRLAVPLIYPTIQSHGLCFSMWPMRMVNLEVILKREDNVYLFSEYPQQIVSFVRINRPSFSKSILLNNVLSEQPHPTFFNRDCALGLRKRKVLDGIVEASWYIPSGKDTDFFKDLTLFANLRGDSLDFVKQLDTLREISRVMVLVINWLDLKREIESVENIAKEGLSLVILLIGKHQKKDREKILDRLTKSCSVTVVPSFRKGSEQNISDLTKQITKKIRSVFEHVEGKYIPGKSLEECAEIAEKNGIANDEQNERCSNAKNAAVKLMEFVYDIKEPLEVKLQLMPLQGEIFCEIVQLESELKKMNSDKLSEKEGIKDKILELRRKQRDHTLPDIIKDFIRFFKEKKSDAEAVAYFIHWMKFLLNKYTESVLPKITKKRQEKWKEYEKATRSQQSNIDDIKKDLQLAEISTENVSLSFEHFVRELSQIYESCQLFEPQKENPNLQQAKNLPEVAANILLQGHPLELMNGNVDSIPLAWIEAVLSSCISQIGDKKVYVLSVLGIQSSGKSSFLNTIFGINFDVRAGRCTRGIFMKLIPVAKKDNFPFDYLLILDTEGLRAPERGSNTIYCDNKLATLVFGIANTTLINIMGENKMEIIGVLEIVVHALLKLKRANGNICFNTSCLFVHQNVNATDANDRIQPGHQVTVQDLDRITKEIAKELGFEEITAFHQIIRFDSEEDVDFISNIWNGVPPMAHANPGYSNKCDDVKQKLLSRMLEKRGNSMTMSTFLDHLTDLWKGLMSEDFILGFRNNVEVKAYITMEMEYHSKKWNFEEFKTVWMIDNGNKDHEISAMNQTIEEEFGIKKNRILKSLQNFFENSPWRGILSQWEDSQIKSMELYCDNVIETTKKKMQKIQYEKELERKAEVNYKRLLQEIDEVAKSLAKEKKSTGRKITELFEPLWTKIMGEVLSDDNTVSESIGCRIRDMLLSFNRILGISLNEEMESQQQRLLPMELRVGDLDKCEPGKHFEIRLHADKQITVTGHVERVEQFTKSLFYDVSTEINANREQSSVDFQEAHLIRVLKMIRDQCEEHNAMKNDLITFLPKYQAMVMVYVCRYVEHVFTEAQRLYEQQLSPKAKIHKYKNASMKHFENMLSKRSNEYMAASLLCEEAKVELERRLQEKVILEQQTLIRAEFSHSKEKLICRILKDLVKQNQYGLFKEYLDLPKDYAKKWFCALAGNIRASENFLYIMKRIVNDFCQELKHDVLSAKSSLSEPFKMEDFLLGISNVPVSDHTQEKICQYDINSMENFVVEVNDLLSEIEQNNVDTFVSEWGNKKDIEVFNDLWGCQEVCPFCNEPCRYMKDHTQINVPHRCIQHRPLGLCDKHRKYSEEFTLDSCCFKVGSKQVAHCKVFENKCKTTHSDHVSDDDKHPYKQYKKFLPDWDIERSPDMESSKFWMWFIAKYKDELSETHGLECDNIPNSWLRITGGKAIKSLPDNTGRSRIRSLRNWFKSNK